MLKLGKTTDVVVRGRHWTIGRLEQHVVRGLRDWIETQVGDPFATARQLVDIVPESTAKELINAAMEARDQLQAFTLDCELARAWLATELGMAKLIQLLLGKAHPEATQADGMMLLLELGMEKLNRILKDASGETPANRGHGKVQSSRPGPVDWYEIYRRLMFGRGRFRPWEIDNMTLPEIVLGLDEPRENEHRPPPGAVASGHDEVLKHLAWLRSLTPRQRLEAAEAGKL